MMPALTDAIAVPAQHGPVQLPPTVLVIIASAGHSGSTLLDLLLGNHSQVSGVGEMNRLTLYPGDRACACGRTIAECGYWNRVRETMGSAAGRGGPVRWSEYHTDVPPQAPLLEIEPVEPGSMMSGAPVPTALRSRLARAGLEIPGTAVLSRGGTRDVKWRLVDAEGRREYVIRHDDGRLQVYAPLTRWKNPLRVLPSLTEVAAVVGSVGLARAAAAVSRRAAQDLQSARNSWTVADAAAAADGTRMVVDSSKSAVRLKLLYMLRPERVRILSLVRDGRAVAASAMRRHDMSITNAARIWKRENQHLAAVLRTVPARLKHRVSYERLCEDPAGELRRICGFLGLEFEPGLLALWEREVHNIPGNPMLFQRSRRTISKDERWRRDLTEDDLRRFAAVAGPMNRSFGQT